MTIADISTDAYSRAILRDRILRNAIARAAWEATRQMRCNQCNLGNHAGDFPGCTDDGSTCLCECHDPKG